MTTDLTKKEMALTPDERRSIGLSRGQANGKRRRTPVPGGYAAVPGTGPEGETCKTCAHIVRKQMSKTYIKCGLMRERWTGGGKTDIRAKSPACKQWKSPEVSP